MLPATAAGPPDPPRTRDAFIFERTREGAVKKLKLDVESCF